MLYEKAFQKELWEAVRTEKAYAPLLGALLEDYRAVSEAVSYTHLDVYKRQVLIALALDKMRFKSRLKLS